MDKVCFNCGHVFFAKRYVCPKCGVAFIEEEKSVIFFYPDQRRKYIKKYRKRYRENKYRKILVKIQIQNEEQMREDLIRKEKILLINMALEKVPPMYVDFLRMKYLEAKTNKEIEHPIQKQKESSFLL